MASPQTEDGYTKFANELLEAMVKTRIPGQELRIVLFIARKTYGYGRKQDQISYGQIAKATDIPRTRVIQHIKSLVSKMVLGSLNNGTRQPVTLWINKDYEKWEHSPIKGTSPNSGTKTSPNSGTHKRKKERKEYKEKSKRQIPLSELPKWLNKELWLEYREHRKAIKAKMNELAEKKNLAKLEKLTKESGATQEDIINQSIEYGWKGLFPIKEQYGKTKENIW